MDKYAFLRRINIYSWSFTLVQMFFLYAWISVLPKTDSFFSVYSLFAVAGLACLVSNHYRKPAYSGRTFWGSMIFSAAFSLSAIMGNYMLFDPITALMSLFNMGLCFVGGIVVAQNILLCALDAFPLTGEAKIRTGEKQVFALSFLCVVAVDLVYLFFTNYPAILDPDTLSELSQALGYTPYSTWTPYWHTRSIELILDPAYAVLGDVNAALACVTVAQVLFFAVCFGYALVTLYQMGFPRHLLGIAFFIYVLYPYNIVFNVTPGKDVSFGVALLLLLTALLRILTNTGKKEWLNYVMLMVGSFGFCLWRTNGLYIYLITVAVLLLTLRMKKKWLLAAMVSAAVICSILNGPYLESKNYQEIPFTETLAVPFQQIGRVIVNEREIPEADEAFLAEIFRMDEVKEKFTPESVDPMKFEVFRNADFLKENFGDFLGIWLRLGLKYPGDYLRAWIDETRGYWNGGYHMGVYNQGIPNNQMGIYAS